MYSFDEDLLPESLLKPCEMIWTRTLALIEEKNKTAR
jgi:hypothetical protein